MRRRDFISVLGGATVLGSLSGRELLAHAPDALLHAFVAAGLGIMLRMVIHRHDVPANAEAESMSRAICRARRKRFSRWARKPW